MTAVTVTPEGPLMPGTDAFARAAQPLSSHARDAMAPLGQILMREMDRYIDNQLENIFTLRPHLAGNADFESTIREICRYNITALARILAGSDPCAETAAVRTMAYSSGEMLSRAGTTLPELLEVYRRGQALLLQDFLGQAFGELESTAPFNEIVHQCMLWWGGHVDETLSHTVEGLVKNYERLRTHFQAKRQHAVEAILQGRLTDAPHASSELRYELSDWHVGLVISQPSLAVRDDFESAVERFTDHAAQAHEAHRTLVVASGSLQRWAWIGSGARFEPSPASSLLRAASDLGLRVSMGTPSRGLPGFVATNRQARYARLAMENIPDGAVLVSYRDVAILSLIRSDRDQVRTFVKDQLGGLASSEPRMAELRHTVAVFLTEGRNAPRAAEALHTHKNTVHYRIARAEEIRRRPISDAPLELELALRLVADYGDWTIDDQN